MLWPNSKRKWVATSPNIPTFESALVYPGMGLVGLTRVNEGRGTRSPFSLFAAPWFDGVQMARRLNMLRLPGVDFKTETYTPRSIKGIAARPLYKGQRLKGVRLVVKDIKHFEPLETGIHVLCALASEARGNKRVRMFTDLPMFHLLAGTKKLHRMLVAGKTGDEIIASWQDEVAKFKRTRRRYLLY
jgi:uncharacterized protein YbbC (DUF1343 family)